MSIRREMGEVNYFKNFNMGREIEIAGEFIYESMSCLLYTSPSPRD